MSLSFSMARIPPIHFGVGTLSNITPWLSERKISKVVLVTGLKSLDESGHLGKVKRLVANAETELHEIKCAGEPSVEYVDQNVKSLFAEGIDGVISIGGGSIIDLGKALAAMLPHGNSVFDHLEGVGKGLAHSGLTLPFLAIPTTSGTGGEVTKNAVLSKVGEHGFKKSLRHDNFVPDSVILDGELLVSAGNDLTAACGMDAFTQLLEPYFSPKATPMTDAIVWSGLENLVPNLLLACGQGAKDPNVRLKVAYGALCSGIGLANAGLGIVHGLAGPIGGWFPIPHGVVCGTLIASAQRQNWSAIKRRNPDNFAVSRMARIGRLMPGGEGIHCDIAAVDYFTDTLENWVDFLKLPRLGSFGLTMADIDRIVKAATNRNNPIDLNNEEIYSVLESRL